MPRAAATTISRTTQSAMPKNGKTCVATCTTNHATAAYSVPARNTLRRLSSARNLITATPLRQSPEPEYTPAIAPPRNLIQPTYTSGKTMAELRCAMGSTESRRGLSTAHTQRVGRGHRQEVLDRVIEEAPVALVYNGVP